MCIRDSINAEYGGDSSSMGGVCDGGSSERPPPEVRDSDEICVNQPTHDDSPKQSPQHCDPSPEKHAVPGSPAGQPQQVSPLRRMESPKVTEMELHGAIMAVETTNAELMKELREVQEARSLLEREKSETKEAQEKFAKEEAEAKAAQERLEQEREELERSKSDLMEFRSSASDISPTRIAPTLTKLERKLAQSEASAAAAEAAFELESREAEEAKATFEQELAEDAAAEAKLQKEQADVENSLERVKTAETKFDLLEEKAKKQKEKEEATEQRHLEVAENFFGLLNQRLQPSGLPESSRFRIADVSTFWRNNPEAAAASEVLLSRAFELVAVPSQFIDQDKPELVKRIKSPKDKVRHLRNVMKVFFDGYEDGGVQCECDEGEFVARGMYIEMLKTYKVRVSLQVQDDMIVQVTESRTMQDV
eukprot:TRINITY_DN22581_c0_g1_i1.p1 TRINITY_DN22581_c0_g1~~TRINITY_DN22581_c0_g1_i1.p1  ORF type:complete len:422 (+),score=133.51 TRINITY_DN22581_c0_g1_i1:172-1437(+)